MTKLLNIITYFKHLGVLFNDPDIIKTFSKASLRNIDMYDYILDTIPTNFKEHLIQEAKAFKSFKDSNKDIFDQSLIKMPNRYLGNFHVYRATHFIVSKDLFEDTERWVKQHIMVSDACAKEVSSVRSHSGSKAVKLEFDENDTSGTRSTYIKFRLVAETLANLVTLSNKASNKMHKHLNKVRYNYGSKVPFTFPIAKLGGFQLINLWGNYILNHGKKFFIFTDDHMKKTIDLLKSIGNISMGITMLNNQESTFKVVTKIVDLMYRLAKEDPESVGEWLKAARNLLVCRLDRDHFFDKSMETMMKSDYDEKKKEMAEYILEVYNNYFAGKIDQLMFSHIYKIVPHPDADLRQGFEKIKGLQDPNSVEEESIKLFEGTLRRSLYISLKEQNHDIRADDGDPALIQKINATSVELTTIKLTEPIRWFNIKFSPVRSLLPPSKIDVPVGDKSSATNHVINDAELSELKEYSKRHLFSGKTPESLHRIRNINDITSVLKGKDELQTEPAMKRFRNLIELNKKFESKFPDKEPEQIPTEKLEEFVKEIRDTSYNVFTEPKLGEKHKKITRMFYMGEQMLKILTQKIERFGKNISKKQTGVSIVKDYTARRKDLEVFCDTMRLPAPNSLPLYISFDMSQFSMKFPMKLLRIYGKIIAELSGEDEWERVDLFFRMSKVFHSSRGFFDEFAGVKGGFEGFLNFIWSSIHATVMEIALHQIGLDGYLLTYSDDGLLQIMLSDKTTKDAVVILVHHIQSIYKKLGLIFHLGKTMISTNVWEYLGDICYEGHLIPMWFKEISSFGIFEPSEGFKPFAVRKDAIVGQVNALCMKGFNPYLSEYMGLFETCLMIKRAFPKIYDMTMIALLILPVSCGGLRFPTCSQLSIVSSIDSYSEFLADLHSIKKMHPTFISNLINMLIDRLDNPNNAHKTLMSGNYLATDLPDSSGLSIFGSLVDKVASKSVIRYLVGNRAYSDSQMRQFASIMQRIENLDPQIMVEFFLSTPNWKEFSDMVSLIKSKSALKILNKNDLRRAQSRDTRNIGECIEQITMYIHKRNPFVMTVDNLHEKVFSYYLRDYDVLNPRPSPRLLLCRVNDIDDCDIKVSIDLSDMDLRPPHNLDYVEPSNLPSNSRSLLSWTSELVASKRESYIRKFLQVYSSILVKNPDCSEAFQDFTSVIGIEVPTLPQNTMHNINRLKHYMTGKVDVFVGAPCVLKARSSLRMGRRLMNLYNDPVSADRTTYQECARWMAITEFLNTRSMKRYAGDKPFEYSYNLVTYNEIHFIHPPMSYHNERFVIRNYDTSNLGTLLKSDFNLAIEEGIRNASLVSVLREPTKISIDKLRKESAIITEMIITDISEIITRFINSSYISGPTTMMSSPATISLYQAEIGAAYIKSFYDWCINKKFLSNTIFGWVYENKYELFKKVAELYEEFAKLCAENLYNLPSSIYNDKIVSVQIADVPRFKNLLKRYASSLMLAGNLSPPIVVFDNTKSVYNMATHSRVKAIKRALEGILDNIYNLGKIYKWNNQEIIKRLGLNPKGINVDWLLDNVTICLDILRSSKHRTITHPYNKTTYMIESFKYRTMISESQYIKFIDESSIKEYIKAFTFNRKEKEYLYKMLRLTEADVDHIELLSMPVTKRASKRALLIIKTQLLKSRKLYDTLIENIKPDLHVINSDQTAFHELIMLTTINSINVYSTATKHVLYENLPDYQNLKIVSIGKLPEIILLKGSYMDANELEEETLNLISSMSISTLIDCGIQDVTYSKNFPAYIVSKLALNSFEEKGKKAKNQLRFNSIESGLSLNIISLKSDIALAVAAIMAKGVKRPIVVKEGDSYIIAFVNCVPMNNIELSIKRSPTPKPKGFNYTETDFLIVNVEEYTDTLNMLYNIRTKVGTIFIPKKLHMQTAKIPEPEEIKVVKSRNVLLGEHPYLSVAIVLNTGARDSWTSYASYIALLGHLVDFSPDDPRGLVDLFFDIYRTDNKWKKKAIENDIRAAVTWLKIQNVTIPLEKSQIAADILEELQAVWDFQPIDISYTFPGIPTKIEDFIYVKGAYSASELVSDRDDWLMEGLLFSKVDISMDLEKMITANKQAALDHYTITTDPNMNRKQGKEEQ